MDPTSIHTPTTDHLSAVSAAILKDGYASDVFLRVVPVVSDRIAVLEKISAAILSVDRSVSGSPRYPAAFVTGWMSDPSRAVNDILNVMRVAIHA